MFRPGRGRTAIQFVRILRRCTPRSLHLKTGGGPHRVLLAVASPIASDHPSLPCRRCTPRSLHLKAGGGPIRVLLARAEPTAPDVPSFESRRWLLELARGLARSPE